jgi:thiol-disulfide isomerase/thioredoxin
MRNLLLALILLSATQSAAPYPAPAATDKAAPAFEAKDAAGKIWTLADTQKKPVLIDFWATWCKPCLESMPDLNAFYKAHQAKVGLLGLNLDTKGWATAKPVVAKYALSYPIAVIDPKLSKSFGAKGFPFMAVVYQGKIVKTLSGAHRLKDLEKELAPWL